MKFHLFFYLFFASFDVPIFALNISKLTKPRRQSHSPKRRIWFAGRSIHNVGDAEELAIAQDEVYQPSLDVPIGLNSKQAVAFIKASLAPASELSRCSLNVLIYLLPRHLGEGVVPVDEASEIAPTLKASSALGEETDTSQTLGKSLNGEVQSQ